MPTNGGDIIRVVAGFAYRPGGTPQSNVIHLVDAGAGGITDANLLIGVGTFLEVVYTTVQAVQSTTYQYTTYSVANITQGTIIGTLPWPTFTAGLAAAAVDAAQVVGLLRMVTARTRVQGRVNVGGIPETNIADSILSVGVQAAILAMGTALIGPFIIAPSAIEYIVFNTTLLTFNLPVSAALGVAVRTLGRRKEP